MLKKQNISLCYCLKFWLASNRLSFVLNILIWGTCIDFLGQSQWAPGCHVFCLFFPLSLSFHILLWWQWLVIYSQYAMQLLICILLLYFLRTDHLHRLFIEIHNLKVKKIWKIFRKCSLWISNDLFCKYYSSTDFQESLSKYNKNEHNIGLCMKLPFDLNN